MRLRKECGPHFKTPLATLISSTEVLLPRQAEVEPESHGEEVDELCHAERAETQTQAKQAADVREEVYDAVELAPLVAHEVQVLEVHVDDGQVVADVRVVGVLRVLG